MDDIICELFAIFFELPNDFFDRDYVNDNFKELDIATNNLLQALPAEKKCLFYDYETAHTISLRDEALEAFRIGLTLGLRINRKI